MILARGALGFVTGALNPQLPLMLEGFGFSLELLEGRQRQGQLIGCQGVR